MVDDRILRRIIEGGFLDTVQTPNRQIEDSRRNLPLISGLQRSVQVVRMGAFNETKQLEKGVGYG
jgi:hypothetical protein